MAGLIHLVRHGHHAEVGRVLSGRSEIALDEAGRAEAAALPALLAGSAIAAIHSSPRRRARETAAPLAAARRLEVTIAPALDEIDFGAFTGRSFAELDGEADWRRWNAERATARCPRGETMAEATARALAYLSAIADPDRPALCVSHCDVIRGVVAALLGLAYDRIFALDCDPGSVTTLWLGGGGDRLVALNRPVQR